MANVLNVDDEAKQQQTGPSELVNVPLGTDTCSKCRRQLPANIQNGDRCPHCNAFLALSTVSDSGEEKTEVLAWSNFSTLQKAMVIFGGGLAALVCAVVVKYAIG